MPVKLLRHPLSILKAATLATYKDWMAYRSSVALSLFVGPVFFLVQVAIWTAVYQSTDDIAGFTLQGMIRYYGATALMGYLTIDYSDYELQEHIRKGTFITFLLRPVSYGWYALCQKLGHRLLAVWLEFLPVALLFLLLFRVDLRPAHPLWTAVSIALSFLLVFFVNFSIGLLSFWFTRNDGFRRAMLILRDFCSGTLLPLSLLPLGAQKILMFLPFQYLAYVPGRVFIGSYELAGMTLTIPQIVGLQALMTLAMLGIAAWMWRSAVRRFTGVGT